MKRAGAGNDCEHQARQTHTIMQSIMNTFHSAMKIRKYLRLSKNSRMLSPAKAESRVHEAVTQLTTKLRQPLTNNFGAPIPKASDWCWKGHVTQVCPIRVLPELWVLVTRPRLARLRIGQIQSTAWAPEHITCHCSGLPRFLGLFCKCFVVCFFF